MVLASEVAMVVIVFIPVVVFLLLLQTKTLVFGLLPLLTSHFLLSTPPLSSCVYLPPWKIRFQIVKKHSLARC